jgi:hypothetical protein
VTNFGTRAILALPKMPERRLRFLLALETFTRREDGWREAGTELLASAAGLSAKTTARARRELAASGAIEYRRGNGRGQLGTYRLKVPSDTVHLPEPGKVPSDGDHLSEPGKVVKQPRKGGQTGLEKVGTGHSLTSGNAIVGLEPIALESSGLARAPAPAPAPARDALIDVIRTEIKKTTGDDLTDGWAVKIGRHILDGHQAGNPAAYIRSVIQNEPSPRLRFLSQSGEHRPRPPDPGPPSTAPGPAAGDGDSSGQPASLNGQRPGPGDERPGPGYGHCPDCGRWYRLSGYGWLIPHLVPGYQSYCPGRAPAEPVPCVRCRQTGIALAAQSGLCNKCGKATRADANPPKETTP